MLGRFSQADTIVPQGLDRYSYIENNPVNGTDPTGHCPEDDEECRARLYATLPDGGSTTGNLINQGGNTAGNLINQGGNTAGNQINQGGNTAGNLLNQGGAEFQANYDFDAIGVGFGGSAGIAPWQIGGGAEGLYIFDSDEIAAYGYGGPSGLAGEGGAGNLYLIFAFNVDDSSDYTGVSNSVTGTATWGLTGVSASYFWGGDAPLTSGAPQGITIGWAFGAKLSVAFSQLTYNLIGAQNDK